MKEMQIVGTMPDTGLYELKPETKRAAQSSSRVSISELAVGSPDHASHGANNGQIRSRLKAQFRAAVRNGDQDTITHMRRAKEMSDEEAKAGMADGPLPSRSSTLVWLARKLSTGGPSALTGVAWHVLISPR